MPQFIFKTFVVSLFFSTKHSYEGSVLGFINSSVTERKKKGVRN